MRKKILSAIGAFVFLASAGYMASGAQLALLTGASGCNEASQLLFCMNTLISQLNGSTGAIVSFGTGGVQPGFTVTGNTTSQATLASTAVNGTSPKPDPGGGVLSGPLSPGTTNNNTPSPQTPAVLNAQRGLVSFSTNLGSGGTGNGQSSTLMVVNSYITSTTSCVASLNGSGNTVPNGQVVLGNVTPTVGIWSGTTSQGVLLFNLVNVAANGALPTANYSISFWCQ